MSEETPEYGARKIFTHNFQEKLKTIYKTIELCDNSSDRKVLRHIAEAAAIIYPEEEYWVARDADRSLRLFTREPALNIGSQDEGHWYPRYYNTREIRLPREAFPEVSCNECQRYTIE